MIEILLDANEKRLTTFPIKYPVLWDKYKKMESCFGLPEKSIYLKMLLILKN